MKDQINHPANRRVIGALGLMLPLLASCQIAAAPAPVSAARLPAPSAACRAQLNAAAAELSSKPLTLLW